MIAILDFGSQYTQLIARRLREQKIYCEIFPHTLSALQLKAYVREIKGIILSGGPQSVYQTGSPGLNDNIFKFGIPVLGICYGMQYITHRLGGKVTKAKRQEYGFAGINIMKKGIIFDGLPERFNVWMSHGDALQNLPHSFTPLASTQNCKYASVADIKRKIYGLQFHPEVEHTQYGKVILGNFAKKICKEKAQWRFSSFIREKVKEIRETVKNERVILALSGGVDSSVCAVLLHRALGRRISCVFVDNGCLRKGESAEVENFFRKVLKNHLIHIDAGKTFLKALKGITDPELKRKITGKTFIDVFEKTARKIGNIKFL
ncbi:MAG: glutamine-hydrolyzing GMP synthase, partial [Elusimicrobiota bacterium]